MMGIDCDIDLQEHRMIRPAYRLGCRLPNIHGEGGASAAAR